ncbi:MAG: hypothetical protein ACODAB_00795 [Gemmatimonadota bacterium]
MVEHLTREQIAALLDESDAAAGGRSHLDVCAECASEFEAMSRTRMALSGLADLQAPQGGWDAIRARLAGPDTAGPHGRAGARGRGASTLWWKAQGRWGPLMTAAAILLLFLGGLGVGRMLAPAAPGAAGPPDEVANGATTAAPTFAENVDPEYLRSVADLEELRRDGPSLAQIADDPELAAVRLTHLDALIEASREALREAPADAALNDFLFDVVDERASVAGQLGRSIRQASMEY